MFYSQFILAKKGPLGTIWIAAHLERKLRKNQVADTDIGVSVDSILFPDVPIALRLSSHLLLGVVRIYSRKVNYLFHDSSEALLKIKQAFRSAAVDLPPEESTAPYHSITLPETFHLDDFVLPDSAIEGDFVDQHVSTKEQITLQDNMDGTGYSAMQFGLDERFGDGNSSQIGLDLDEGLFMEDNLPSSHHISNTAVQDECAEQQGQISYVDTLTHMDIDDDQRGLPKDVGIEDLRNLSKPHESQLQPTVLHVKNNDGSSQCQGYNVQTADITEIFSSNGHIEDLSGESSQTVIGSAAYEVPLTGSSKCDHAPSTPGLMEEFFSASIPESPALSPQQRFSPSTGEEAVKPKHSNLQSGQTDAVTVTSHLHGMTIAKHAVQLISLPTSESSEHRAHITTPDETHISDDQKSVDDLHNGSAGSEAMDLTVTERVQDNRTTVLPEVSQAESLAYSNVPNFEATPDNSPIDAEILPTSKMSAETAVANGVTSATNSTSEGVRNQPSNCYSTEQFGGLHSKSCTSQVNQTNELCGQYDGSPRSVAVSLTEEPGVPSQISAEQNKLPVTDSPFETQDNGLQITNSVDAELEIQEHSQNMLTDSTLLNSNRNELLVDLSQKDTQRNHMNCSSSSEFPEPEKMLAAPSANAEQANELSQLSEEKGVVDSDGSVGRMSSLAGKKRHLMEITPTLQKDGSRKMSGRSRLQNTENVPDDNDLLASILVGKRTPLLRVELNPLRTSQKRPGLAPRLPMKRKVLLDDTTVLHAEAIRQQLMNTEDIRRIRKKAPCTRPEVWMIQKSSLEDELFNDLIIPGVSAQLNDIHKRMTDLKINQNCSFYEATKECYPSTNMQIVREANEKDPAMLISIRSNDLTAEIPGLAHISLASEGICFEDMKECGDQQQPGSVLPLPERSSNDGECMMLTTEIIEKDKVLHTILPTAVPASLEFEPLPDDVVHSRNNSSVLNNDVLYCAENSSANDQALVDGDSIARVVCNSGLVAVNDDPTMQVEDAHIASDASLVNSCESVAVLTTNSSTIIYEGGISFQDVGQRMLGAEVENEALVQKMQHDDENLNVDAISSEKPGIISRSPTHQNSEIENAPSEVGESSCLHDFNLEGGMLAVSTPVDLVSAKDCSDFCSAINGNDTEFLNVDDEGDYHEDADNDVPDAENGSLDNSGWSSRTRGVARYLKILFDDGSRRERKSVAMDQLIAGKTRKEASRMFFETLVLKTKDFIHVEQENPAGYITIRPRAKLLKAEF